MIIRILEKLICQARGDSGFVKHGELSDHVCDLGQSGVSR